MFSYWFIWQIVLFSFYLIFDITHIVSHFLRRNQRILNPLLARLSQCDVIGDKYSNIFPPHTPIYILIISTYINTKMSICLFVCLFIHVFLGHFETDWDTLLHKVSFRHRMSCKTIKFQKKLFFAELLPFFYISLRFLCKFEERL